MSYNIWEVLSLVGHPLLQLPFWFALITFYLYGPLPALTLSLIVILGGSIVPYLLYRGKNADLREIRPRVLFISSFVYILISILLSKYIVSAVGLLITALVSFIDGLISLKWKISIHATAITGFIVYAYLIIGSAVLIAVPFGFLVILSRLILGKHDGYQLAAGSVLGFLITFSLWYLLVKN